MHSQKQQNRKQPQTELLFFFFWYMCFFLFSRCCSVLLKRTFIYLYLIIRFFCEFLYQRLFVWLISYSYAPTRACHKKMNYTIFITQRLISILIVPFGMVRLLYLPSRFRIEILPYLLIILLFLSVSK